MKKFNEYLESIYTHDMQASKNLDKIKSSLGGGLPSATPNYANSAQHGTSGHINIGQAHLTVTGNALQIDTENHSIRLPLTPQQIAQLEEFNN